MKILITGGAGYIGSITNRMLREKGHETVIFDNLSAGHREAAAGTELIVGDLTNEGDIRKVFDAHRIDAVIHFAALALAGESMQKPALYYRNNILGGLNLLEAMRQSETKTIVFSSTCAVYGFPEHLPVTEHEPYKPVSVYGSSKRMFEEVLEWYERIYGFRFASLRYFNAAGALPDGSLGEDHPAETHIIPIAIQVAQGKRPEFEVFGNDYDTPDGTCIRDYIHVLDLADAHLKAIEYIGNTGMSVVANLGIGNGYSNLEILKAIEDVSGKEIKRSFKPRRPGDPDRIFADNSRARELLGWKPVYTDLREIIKTAWEWHSTHPDGFS